jgi:four helix bundle protein
MQPHHRLDAWKAAHAFALAVYRATATWPSAERHGLVGQVRRAAFSVPANIVEGRARIGAREFRRFLTFSWASLAEAGYALEFARELGYLTEDAHASLEQLRAEAGRPLWGLLMATAKAGT